MPYVMLLYQSTKLVLTGLAHGHLMKFDNHRIYAKTPTNENNVSYLRKTRFKRTLQFRCIERRGFAAPLDTP